jgi:hypothetical protein
MCACRFYLRGRRAWNLLNLGKVSALEYLRSKGNTETRVREHFSECATFSISSPDAGFTSRMKPSSTTTPCTMAAGCLPELRTGPTNSRCGDEDGKNCKADACGLRGPSGAGSCGAVRAVRASVRCPRRVCGGGEAHRRVQTTISCAP